MDTNSNPINYRDKLTKTKQQATNQKTNHHLQKQQQATTTHLTVNYATTTQKVNDSPPTDSNDYETAATWRSINTEEAYGGNRHSYFN